MDRAAVLAEFDEQIRADPRPVASHEHVEREDGVVRFVSDGEGWTGVTWCDLDEDNADRVIASQIVRFAELPGPWEWKHYSYDRPADLADRLRAAGFTPEPPEALLFGETAGLPHVSTPPSGVEIVPVVDERGVSSFVSVNNEVFGDHNAWIGEMLLADMAGQRTIGAAVLAVADRATIGALRLELVPDTDFAVLFSACTLRAWRGRGVFRALLAHGVTLAADGGFTYMQADAFPDSQPILKRLGFVELGRTTPFMHAGGQSSRSNRRMA